ncbi:MAG: 3-deoxy-8-phosphooctulonate synthase [Planctomycetota bacterium]|nr:MAG: 3-deoxy-8-phosphooctulonate synthase [Planctomycetota bacterium]
MAERHEVEVGGRPLRGEKPFFISGPCVLETRELAFEIAGRLAELFADRGATFIFKASFDKANRSSLDSGRGVGLELGLEWLADIKASLGVPVLTDVHVPDQCSVVGEIVDVLQIPAFLCRQTDLLVAAARTGKVVNIKKGQFLSPWDMRNTVRKVTESGNPNVILTERGTSFGYGRLVVDMAGFRHLAATGCPVVFDATHSVQEPGALGDKTGGDRTLVPALARAAVATGEIDGLFFEVHPDPDSSPSDGPNMLRLDEFPRVVDGVLAVSEAVRGGPSA